MPDVTEDQKKPVQQPSARPYHSPRLSVFGAVRELTAQASTIVDPQVGPPPIRGIRPTPGPR